MTDTPAGSEPEIDAESAVLPRPAIPSDSLVPFLSEAGALSPAVQTNMQGEMESRKTVSVAHKMAPFFPPHSQLSWCSTSRAPFRSENSCTN